MTCKPRAEYLEEASHVTIQGKRKKEKLSAKSQRGYKFREFKAPGDWR